MRGRCAGHRAVDGDLIVFNGFTVRRGWGRRGRWWGRRRGDEGWLLLWGRRFRIYNRQRGRPRRGSRGRQGRLRGARGRLWSRRMARRWRCLVRRQGRRRRGLGWSWGRYGRPTFGRGFRGGVIETGRRRRVGRRDGRRWWVIRGAANRLAGGDAVGDRTAPVLGGVRAWCFATRARVVWNLDEFRTADSCIVVARARYAPVILLWVGRARRRWHQRRGALLRRRFAHVGGD